MGGQLWTETEEDYFWEEIVPNSDKKLGYTRDQRSQVKTWEQLAADMRAAMATKFRKLGKEVPRKYTALTLGKPIIPSSILPFSFCCLPCPCSRLTIALPQPSTGTRTSCRTG